MKNCQEDHQVKSIIPDICFLVLAPIRQVRQNFGTRRWRTGFLLVTRYFIVTHYFLLVTRYFLLVTTYLFLVATFLLPFSCYLLLFTCYQLLFIRYSLLLTCYSLLYFSFVATYSLLIAFYSLYLFITFYYFLVKLRKMSYVKNLNISQYASNLHIERLKKFQNLFQLSINNFRNPRNAVKSIGKTYVRPHIKHFSKYEAAISELRAAFGSLYAWLKLAQYCSI